MPLDGDFAKMLLDWRATKPLTDVGLVFRSPVTGGCFHAGGLMKKHIRPAGEKVGLQHVGWHSFRHT
jgi:hypothetical protein